LNFKFTKVDPSKFIPSDILKKIGLSAQLSGDGRIKGGVGITPFANLNITQLEIKVKGKPHPYIPTKKEETLKLGKTAHLTYANNGISITDFKLIGNHTNIEASGLLGIGENNLSIKGDANLGLIPYFLPEGILNKATGSISINMGVKKIKKNLALNGSIYFAGNKLYLGPDETLVTIRSGKIDFKEDQMILNKIRIVHEEEEVVVAGMVSLDENLKPTMVALTADGAISSKILELFASGSFYSLQGRAHIQTSIIGPVKSPNISGSLIFKEKVALFLRSGRELTFEKGGSINFSGPYINLSKLKVTMEDGYVELNGDFLWKNNRPQDANVDIKIRNLVERSSGTYEAEALGDLKLSCIKDKPLELKGIIELLNAKYTKKYEINLVNKLLTPKSRTSESGAGGSALASIPWLHQLILNINVQLTGDIEIDNNFAQTKLEGVVKVGGTLSSPHIGGRIQLTGGTFKIPMLRGTYQIKDGLIDFDKAKLLGHTKDEPFIDVHGEMNYTDRSDNDHLISLRITGFVSQIKMKWSSSTGLNSSQVLTLLMLNRTPDEIRRGASSGIPDLTSMLGMGGNLPLNLQLGITSDAVKVYVDRRFLKEHVILKGNAEMGYLGKQKQEARLIFRIHDRVLIQGKAKRRIEDESSISQEDELQGRIELKYKVKLKGSVKNILGY
jgi:ribosomal protein L27